MGHPPATGLAPQDGTGLAADLARGERARGTELRRRLALLAVLVAPALAAAAAGGWVHGLANARANRYFQGGLEHAALAFVAQEVARDLGLTLLLAAPLALLVLLLARRPRARLAAALLAWGAQAAWLSLVLSAPSSWRVTRVRFGIELPNLLWRLREEGQRELLVQPLLALAAGVLLAAWAWRRAPGEADARPAWPGPRSTALAAGALGLALVAWLAALLGPRLVAPPAPSTGRPVIYVTWDSTRADHLSAYGYGRETTPELEVLAADAVLYERAYSQHNWTRPSYMSIMTGRQGWEFVLRRGIDERRTTMAEALANAGYRTLAFVQNPNLEFVFRFQQGFDRYVQVHHAERPERVVELVEARLDELAAGGRPFFLFVHLEQPHWPYERDGHFLAARDPGTPEPVGPEEVARLLHEHRFDPELWRPDDPRAAERLQYLRDLYDGDLRDADAGLGRLVRALDARGLLRESLLLFNSDHGDEFLEHGSFGHAHANLHPELTRVPLLVRFPDSLGIAPHREQAPVANLDLLPTVLDVAGLPVPPDLEGISLLRLDPEAARERPIVSSEGGLVAVRRGDFALVRDYRRGRGPFLYDLRADPHELAPLPSPEQHPAYADLAAYADWWGAEIGSRNEGEGLVTPDMPDELRERLRALGYF